MDAKDHRHKPLTKKEKDALIVAGVLGALWLLSRGNGGCSCTDAAGAVAAGGAASSTGADTCQQGGSGWEQWWGSSFGNSGWHAENVPFGQGEAALLGYYKFQRGGNGGAIGKASYPPTDCGSSDAVSCMSQDYYGNNPVDQPPQISNRAGFIQTNICKPGYKFNGDYTHPACVPCT